MKGWLEAQLSKSKARNIGEASAKVGRGGRIWDTQQVDRISACLELGQDHERKQEQAVEAGRDQMIS